MRHGKQHEEPHLQYVDEILGWLGGKDIHVPRERLDRILKRAIATERAETIEACAKVAENAEPGNNDQLRWTHFRVKVAKMIRALAGGEGR